MAILHTVPCDEPANSPQRPTRAAIVKLWPLVGLLAFTQPTAARAADPAATFVFDAPPDRKGSIMLALYDNEAAFRDDGAAVAKVMLSAATEPPRVVIGGLKPGRYAAKMFLDLKGDGKLATNLFGMPTEPYAFSNNASGVIGPAPWSAAAFTVDADGVTQTITLK